MHDLIQSREKAIEAVRDVAECGASHEARIRALKEIEEECASQRNYIVKLRDGIPT